MKRFSAAYVLGLVVAASGAGTGCTHSDPPPSPQDHITPESYPRAAALEGLDHAVRFGPPVVERSEPGRPMRVSVPLRNIETRDLNEQYRFEFRDDAGRPLRTNRGWAFTKHAGGGAQTTLDANSLEDTAADWRLELRPAR
jgi:hypothetical protein